MATIQPRLADEVTAAAARSALRALLTEDRRAFVAHVASGVSGACTIRAAQAGNEHFQAAPDVEQSFAVRSSGKLTQTITFNTLPARTIGDPPFTVSATASSGLAVSFQAGPVTVCTIAGDVVTLRDVGECTITATQDGNDAFNPATPVVRTFMVTQTGEPPILPVYLPLVGQ